MYREESRLEKEQSGPAPLLLKLTYPRNPQRVLGKLSEELLIELELQSLREKGNLASRTYRIRFNPHESGRFLSAKQHFESSSGIPLVVIDVDALDLFS